MGMPEAVEVPMMIARQIRLNFKRGGTMEAAIVNRSAEWIVGITARIDPRQADYKDLWENRFMPRHDEIMKLAAGRAYCGAYFPSPEAGKVDFVAGMIADESREVPEGLVRREIPGGLYASFHCTMSSIGPTWGTIYREWLPSSGYQEDETRPALEIYPPEMTRADSRLHLLVALKRGAAARREGA